jgi:hypothetical protein
MYSLGSYGPNAKLDELLQADGRRYAVYLAATNHADSGLD